jgi:hypothetical protein
MSEPNQPAAENYYRQVSHHAADFLGFAMPLGRDVWPIYKEMHGDFCIGHRPIEPAQYGDDGLLDTVDAVTLVVAIGRQLVHARGLSH